jgi:hypothetical protein
MSSFPKASRKTPTGSIRFCFDYGFLSLLISTALFSPPFNLQVVIKGAGLAAIDRHFGAVLKEAFSWYNTLDPLRTYKYIVPLMN